MQRFGDKRDVSKWSLTMRNQPGPERLGSKQLESPLLRSTPAVAFWNEAHQAFDLGPE